MQAGGIDKCSDVVGPELERAARPLDGAFGLTVIEERTRTEGKCADVVRIQCEHALGTMDTFVVSLARVGYLAEHTQRLCEKHRALEVLVACARGEAKEFRRALDVAVRESGAREIVVGLEEMRVDDDSLLELSSRFIVVTREGERKAASHVGIREIWRQF